ncbi:hypothetical protein ACVS9P_09000 [Caproicibacterium sp. NSD3]
MGRSANTPIALVGTVEILNVRVPLIEVVMQIVSAVGIDKQAGEHISFSLIGFSFTDFTSFLLYLFPCCAVNARIVHILKDNPIITVVFNPFLILVRFTVCLKIEDVPAILLQEKNFGDGRTVPLRRRCVFMLARVVDASRLPIRYWSQDTSLSGAAAICSRPKPSSVI